MISDEERREVARRLREQFDVVGQGRYVALNGTLFGMQILASDESTLRAGISRLADLIEPSIPADPGEAGLACVDAFIREHTEKPVDRDTPQKVAEEMFGKMRHSTKEEADAYDAMLKSKSVELHPVDRDALLALADEMQRELDECESDHEIAGNLQSQIDRIREACGKARRKRKLAERGQ